MRYERGKILGKGASGVVYLARDKFHPGRRVALKVYHPDIQLTHAQKEWERLSKLYHPSIPEIYEWGQTPEGLCFLAVEWIEGKTLATHFASTPFNQKIRGLFEIAMALHFIHQNGIIHLDLKPENLIVPRNRDTSVKILDFGLSALVQERRRKLPQGTLTIMAPEVLQGQRVDHRADIYSFGILAYRLLVGRLPFKNNPDHILHFHLYETPAIPINLPPPLSNLMGSCLAKNPSHRPSNGLEMAKILNAAGNLKQDLSSYGLLLGTERHQLKEKIHTLFGEIDHELEKKSGPPQKNIWEEYLRRLSRYQGALKALPKKANELIRRLEHYRSRLLFEEGRYKEAASISGDTSELAAARGIALVYLGRYPEGERHLKKALRTATHPLQKAQAFNHLGISCYNQGKYDQALGCYQKSELLFLKAGKKEPLISNKMNQGAAFQQREKYPEALAAYQESLHLAQASQHTYLISVLLNNLANLYLRFGALKEAASFLDEFKKQLGKIKAPFLTAYGELLEGDAAASQEKFSKASSLYTAAKEKFEKLSMVRESEICWGNLFNLAILQKNLKEAKACQKTKEEKLRLELLQGRPASVKQEVSVEILICAIEGAVKQKRLDLARQYTAWAATYFERFKEKVPLEFREGLRTIYPWKQILHFHQTLLEEDPVKIANFKKLLEVSKKMTSEHRLHPLLEFVMDAVIEITGAERGFLVLAKEQKEAPFRIDVARNLDQETVLKPQYKISRTIVLKVLKETKPLLTTDASGDPRLKSAQSVQGLKLKSILCVPLLHRGKCLGVIYVENRFQKGIFTEDHVEILSAFADQAAIALSNARLHEENQKGAQRIQELNEELQTLVGHQSMQLRRLKEEISHKQDDLELKYRYESIIGNSAIMRKVLGLLDRVTDRDISVLITGESGTGKELIARALHFNGPRKNADFVAVNCSAIPAQLLESELFGHARGAFTGADRDKRGLMEIANGGTLFLDELGDMPLELQPKLLRALQEREIRRLGSHQRISIDVRIVSATNKDLLEECKKKNFREDLYYRLNAVQIHLPPLRERAEDIPLLVAHFLEKMTKKIRVTPEAMDLLMRYPWPGNIRELANELERAVTLADEAITPEVLSEKLFAAGGSLLKADGGIRESRQEYEKNLILRTLAAHLGNKTKAARALGISRVALYQKLKKLKIMARRLQE